MDIKSFWKEHKSFHWEVSISAEVRNPFHSSTGIKPPCCHEAYHGRRAHSLQGQFTQGIKMWAKQRGCRAWQQSKKVPTGTAPVVFQKLQLFLLSARSIEAHDRWGIFSGKWWGEAKTELYPNTHTKPPSLSSVSLSTAGRTQGQLLSPVILFISHLLKNREKVMMHIRLLPLELFQAVDHKILDSNSEKSATVLLVLRDR